MPIISDEEMLSRRRCAAAVGVVWDSIAAATEKHGELTGPEWIWVVHEVLGRFVAIHLNEERTGRLDAEAD